MMEFPCGFREQRQGVDESRWRRGMWWDPGGTGRCKCVCVHMRAPWGGRQPYSTSSASQQLVAFEARLKEVTGRKRLERGSCTICLSTKSWYLHCGDGVLLSLLPTMSMRTPPRMVRLFLELWGSLPRLMQGMDMRSIPTAGRPSIEPVIIRARVVWM